MTKYPKHLPADERRLATVAAVIELAAEQNPNDITTAAIAKRMGLTQGAIFRHFANKDAILEAVMSWVSKRLLARVDKAIGNAMSPLAALKAVFLTHVDFVATHPGIPRMLFGELQRQGETLPKKMVKTLLQHYSQRISQLLTEGKEQGELSAELDIHAATLLFVGSIQGLVMQSVLVGHTKNIKDDAERVLAIYSHGIQA